MKHKKVHFGFRGFAVLLVAGVFALSGFVGGAFAPIARYIVNANVSPAITDASTSQISNLPRKVIKLSDTDAWLTPTIDGSGTVSLYRITTPRPQLITPTPATCPGIGNYEWRFYQGTTLVYTHEVTVEQETYTYTVPTTMQIAGDDNGGIAYVPNVVDVGRTFQFPLPNKFIDTNGNDLFDKDTKDLDKLRLEVIKGFDKDGLNPTTIASNYNSAEDKNQFFKELIWKQTEIAFPGAKDAQDNKNLGGKIFGTDSKLHRTFTAPKSGTYYGQYTLTGNSIYKATFDTTKVSAEAQNITDKNGNPNIVFKMPLQFSQTLSGNEMSFNQEFTIPLPTVNVATATDIGKTVADLGFTPIVFNDAKTVTNYTYVIVERYDLTGTVFSDATRRDSFRVDESTNYKFKPTVAGRYVFQYHTTTLFGLGYQGHFDSYLDEPEIHDNYVVYYEHNIMTVNQNQVAPEIKWTVPYAYYASESATTPLASTEKTDGTVPAVAKAVITATGANASQIVANTVALYDMTSANQVLENFGDDKKAYKEAPDLSAYLPGTGTTSSTQIANNGKLVIPAVIGAGNLSSGRDLQFILTLSRGTGSNQERITFDNRASAQTSGNTLKYDPTKPLVIDFDTADKFQYTNGEYSGDLASWKNEADKTAYQISVYAKDDEVAIQKLPTISSPGRTSGSLTYSFSLVSPTAWAKDNMVDPTFNGSITPTQSAYYDGDTLSFREVGVYDKTTTNVGVEYFLIWSGKTGSPEYPAGAIKLGKDNIKNGSVTLSLKKTATTQPNDQEAKVNALLTALGTSGVGKIEVTLIAVAKNYTALTGLVDDNFNATSAWVNFADPALIGNDIKTQIESKDDFDGIKVITKTLKLYNFTYGASPTITVDTTGFSGEIERGETGNLPTIKVTYLGASNSTSTAPAGFANTDFINTQVVVSMTDENGNDTSTGLSGDLFRELSVPAVANNVTSAQITGLTFKPQLLGKHTFVISVYNTGNFVTVYRGTITVTGTPVVKAILNNDGMSTVRMGQDVILPTVTAYVNGKEFVTDDGNQIITKNELGKTSDTDTIFLAVGDKVGTYSIVGNFNGNQIYSKGGNRFGTLAEGTYTFTYKLEFEKDLLKKGDINVSGTGTIPESVTHTLVVTSLVDGDLGIVVDRDGYTYDELQGKKYTQMAINANGEIIAKTDSPREGIVDNYNIYPEMTTSSNRSLTISANDLNSGMELETVGETINDIDYYGFGPIFIPNIYGKWAEGINIPSTHFNLVEAHQVTVSHSTAPSTNIFNSKDFATDIAKPETKIARINGKDYYYFQPLGQVKISKPDGVHLGDGDTAPTTAGDVSDPVVDKIYKDVNFNTINTNGTLHANYGKAYYYHDDHVKVNSADTAHDYKWYVLDYTSSAYKDKVKYDSVSSLKDSSTKPDGTYTISYKLTYGKLTVTDEFKISCGDSKVPEISVDQIEFEKDGIFGKTYKKGASFTLSSKQVKVDAKGGIMTATQHDPVTKNPTDFYADWYVARNLSISILKPDKISYVAQNDIIKSPTSDSSLMQWTRKESVIEDGVNVVAGFDRAGYALRANGDHILDGTATLDWRTYKFDLSESGDYRITLTIRSETGISNSVSYTITVEAEKATTKISPTTIWGIILIVISSGLLVGVVVYFIQTGRKTKFAGIVPAKPVAGAGADPKLNLNKIEKTEKPTPSENA